MKNNLIFDKIYGALVGVAYGDSMGMPSEFWTRERITKHFGKITTFLSAPEENEITKGLKAGAVTDDTYMTLIISEALIEQKGKIDPVKLVHKIICWAEKNKTKVNCLLGPSTKKAFELILSGVPIEETGKNGTTNGSAMRIIPIGITSDWKNLDSLIERVRLTSIATHNTNHAIAAAASIAAAVSYAIYGDNNIDTMIEIAKSASQKGMYFGYESIGANITKRIELAIDIAKGNNDEDILQEIYNVIGTGLSVTESIPAALALAYSAKGDPIRCALLTANVGGDTDTIGAMACGICGAFSGIKAFPKNSIELLSNTNQIDFAELTEKLFQLNPKTIQ